MFRLITSTFAGGGGGAACFRGTEREGKRRKGERNTLQIRVQEEIALKLSPSSPKLGQKICPRLESPRTFRPLFRFSLRETCPLLASPPSRLARFLLERGRLIHPWLPSFFQPRRCNDFNLEVRSQHARERPTLYPSFLPSLSLSLSLFLFLFLCVCVTRRDRRATFSLRVSNDLANVFLVRGRKKEERRERKSKWNGNPGGRESEEQEAAQETGRKRA